MTPFLHRLFGHHIHHHHFGDSGKEVPPWAVDLQTQNDLIIRILEKIMATIEELQTAVARNTDAEDAVVVLLKGISQQLKDAQATGNPQAIADVIAKLDANTAKLGAAVVENTPSA